MKRTRRRFAVLTLSSGEQYQLRFGSCPYCRRKVGICEIPDQPDVWDGVSFTQAGKLEMLPHACPRDPRD
jgi:hypothetical protein